MTVACTSACALWRHALREGKGRKGRHFACHWFVLIRLYRSTSSLILTKSLSKQVIWNLQSVLFLLGSIFPSELCWFRGKGQFVCGTLPVISTFQNGYQRWRIRLPLQRWDWHKFPSKFSLQGTVNQSVGKHQHWHSSLWLLSPWLLLRKWFVMHNPKGGNEVCKRNKGF